MIWKILMQLNIIGKGSGMSKYNLALTPLSKNNEIINCASLFSHLADTYLLGQNSLPHVTLYQFEAEEEIIGRIWQHILDVWCDKPIQLEFKKFGNVTFDNSLFWISLIPNQGGELHKMHKLIAELLDKPIKNNFDPHMTLLNTKNKNYEKNIDMLKKSYIPISDKFVLSLGSRDDAGQLTQIIYSWH